ncbi:MAG: hypothetical protein R2690_17065 [Acidimicrobiales bacterium]
MQGLIVHRAAAGGRTVGLARTTRALGDLRIDGEPVALAERRRVIARALLGDDPTADGRPVDEHRWAWLRQVHGPSWRSCVPVRRCRQGSRPTRSSPTAPACCWRCTPPTAPR